MLPGFRFFLATIVLAASILVFGLGAAALLRATHEEFAVAPSLRTIQPPLPVRARQPEAATPALAMLRVEIPAASTEELPSATSTESASPADAPAQAVETPAAVEAPAAQSSPQGETPSVAANPSSATGKDAATPNDISPSEIAPAPVMAEAPPAPAAAEIAPTPEAVQPVAATAPAPSASVPAAEAPAQTPATTPAVASPPLAEVKSLTANAQAPAPDPSPTRLVAVSATGCEILPSAPDRPGAIPEAPRAASPPAQGNPAKDKTAKLEKEPAATVPKAASRPQQKARANKRRSTAIKHRHHGVPRVRQARHEVVRPQPQPDLFTFLFGGGAQQPTPVRQ